MAQVAVKGLTELRRALRKAGDKEFANALRKANVLVGAEVLERARPGIASVSAHVAASGRVVRSAVGAKLAFDDVRSGGVIYGAHHDVQRIGANRGPYKGYNGFRLANPEGYHVHRGGRSASRSATSTSMPSTGTWIHGGSESMTASKKAAPKKRPLITQPPPRPASAVKARPDAKAEMGKRPTRELKFTLVVEPPDSESTERVQIDVDLRTMTLAERQLVKRALAKMVEPDYAEILLVHGWVVWRRTNPHSSLQVWMDNLALGDITDGVTYEPGHVHWDTTPEGFDPEA